MNGDLLAARQYWAKEADSSPSLSTTLKQFTTTTTTTTFLIVLNTTTNYKQ